MSNYQNCGSVVFYLFVHSFVLFIDFVQVQAYIISSLKKEMPSMFGKDSKKKELIANLGEIYQKIEKEHQISPGDFPNLAKMQVSLKTEDAA